MMSRGAEANKRARMYSASASYRTRTSVASVEGAPSSGSRWSSCVIGVADAGAGVLHAAGLAAGRVARGAIAHPGVLDLPARGLGAAEFAARALYVGAVGVGAARHLGRVTHAPAVLGEPRQVRRVAIVGVERQ